MTLALVYTPPANVTDYTAFLRQVCGFDATVLPDDSPWIPYSLQISIDTVNCTLVEVAPVEAVLAQYNLAADTLINYVGDVTPALTGLSWTGGVVTATAATVLPSNLVVGQQFLTQIADASPLAYNGNVKATVTAGNAFTYTLTSDPGAETVPGTYSLTFFAALRQKWGIDNVSTGVVSESHDESTGASYLNPEQMTAFTIGDLQTLKTPYGRAYMAFAQNYGQTLWGAS